MSLRRLLPSLLSLTLAGIAGASVQNPALERGIKPEKAFEIGTVDHVNLFNGNVTVTLPIGQTYTGDGTLAYSLTLVYNGKLWDWQDRCVINEGYFPWAHASVDSNAGLGWQLSLGRLIPPSPAAGFRNTSRFWLYVGADGGEHVFYRTLHGNDTSAPGVRYSRDGTYLRLVDLEGGRHRLDFPDGMKQFFDAQNRMEKMEDPFGNALFVTYFPNRWVLNDSIRQHTVHFATWNHDGELRPMVSRVDVAVFGGGSASYDFTYGQHLVERPVGHDERNASKWASVPLLEKVRLPDGTYFCMTQNGGAGCAGVQGSYQTTREGQGWNPGVLRKLSFPTRGQLHWTYGAYEFPTSAVPDGTTTRPAPEFLRFAAGVVRREMVQANGVPHGRWTYDSEITFPQPGSQDQPVEMTTEVVDPLDHRTVHYFSAYPGGGSPADPAADGRFFGYPFTVLTDDGAANPRHLSQEIFDGTGNDDRKVFVRYDFDDNGFIETGNKNHYNQRLASRRLRFADASKYRIEESSDFDGLGNYRTQTITGQVPVSPGTRTEYTAFNCAGGTCSNAIPVAGSPWILGTFPYKTQSEAAASERQDFCFDADTGALLGERIRKGSGVGNDDVVRIYTYDAAGNLTSEKHYGGDLAAAPTGGICASGAVPEYRIDHTYSHGQRASTRFHDASHYDMRLGIDPNTGLPSGSWAVADIFTGYDYDELGRLTRVDPEVGHDGRVDFEYCAANDSCGLGGSPTLRIVQKRNRSDVILARQTLVFDDFGRLHRHRRRMPGGAWAEQTTNFDAQGRIKRQSTWKGEHETPYYTFYRQYDPYGRPKQIESPDGKVEDFVYGGDYRVGRTVRIGDRRNGDGSIGETAHTFGTSFDFLGRLAKADEDEETGHLETFYEHDVGGRLTEARSRRRGSSSGTWQVRTFTYDRRGFMIRVKHPESGLYRFGDFDSLGNAGWKAHYNGTVPDGTDLKFEYDDYGRLLRVRDRADGLQPKLRELFYATSNAGVNHTKGKIERAVRYNHVRHPATGVPLQLAVVEDFFYGGRGGRLSSRATEMNGVKFTQQWLYDELGNVSRWTYPQCVEGPCAGIPADPREIEPDYSEGRLVAVPGYAAAITYHPNGLVASVVHANGVTDFIDVAPTGMARPSNIRVATPLGPSELGLHTYDGAGNLVRRQKAGCGSADCDNYYFYDGSGRLTYYHTSSGNWQSYGYDVWGNLELIREFDGQQQLPDRVQPASGATNRLTGAAYQYDAMGRLTHMDGHVVEYDPLDMAASYDFPAEVYIYTADDERFMQVVFRSPDDQDTHYTIRDLDGRPLTRFVQSQRPPTFSTEATETWRVDRDYVYRDNLLLAAETAGAGVKHFSLDHLGTPTLTTGATGDGFAHFYYGFGQQYDANADPEKLRFTGHERDFHGSPADDLDYMHARFHSPHLSRFLTVDPVESSSLEPQSWNKYSYAFNNPLGLVDPNGEEPETPPDSQPAKPNGGAPLGKAVSAVHDTTRSKGFYWAASTVSHLAAEASGVHPLGWAVTLAFAADKGAQLALGERFGAAVVMSDSVSSMEVYSAEISLIERILPLSETVSQLLDDYATVKAFEADSRGEATPGQKNRILRAYVGGKRGFTIFSNGGSSSEIRKRLQLLQSRLARLRRAFAKVTAPNSPR